MLSFFNRGLFFALAGGSFVRATDISGTVTSARANQSIEFVAVTLKKLMARLSKVPSRTRAAASLWRKCR